MKDADVRKEREARAQREADDRALEARKLAGMGWGVEEIVAELERINMVRAPHAYFGRQGGRAMERRTAMRAP